MHQLQCIMLMLSFQRHIRHMAAPAAAVVLDLQTARVFPQMELDSCHPARALQYICPDFCMLMTTHQHSVLSWSPSGLACMLACHVLKLPASCLADSGQVDPCNKPASNGYSPSLSVASASQSALSPPLPLSPSPPLGLLFCPSPYLTPWLQRCKRSIPAFITDSLQLLHYALTHAVTRYVSPFKHNLMLACSCVLTSIAGLCARVGHLPGGGRRPPAP